MTGHDQRPSHEIVQALLESENEVDALRSVVRRFLQGWTLVGTVDGPEWHSDPALDAEENGEFMPVAEPVPAAEVAAIRAARAAEVTS